jgi:hypothetical protein
MSLKNCREKSSKEDDGNMSDGFFRIEAFKDGTLKILREPGSKTYQYCSIYVCDRGVSRKLTEFDYIIINMTKELVTNV